MEIDFGIVEDILDPLEAGRVRVRVFGVHSELVMEVPTGDLPWAMCMTSSYDGSIGGKGKSPTGISNGQLVVVIWLDNQKQIPMVLGSLNGINPEVLGEFLGAVITKNNPAYGFKQEIRSEYIGEPDTNFQARSGKTSPQHSERKSDKATTAKGGSWTEPASKMNSSEYPHSKVIETESGHMIEIDDTPGNERLLDFHKNGSFSEFTNSGHVQKIIGDDYEIVAGGKNVLVKGKLNITVLGDAEINVNGETYVKSGGKATVEAPEIDLGVDSPEPMVMGNKLSTWISTELKAQYDGHYHIGNLGIPTTPPVQPLIEGTAIQGGPVYSKKNRTQI